MSQMTFWSLSQYIHPQMRMEVIFWPHYSRKIVSPRVGWSAGTTSSSSIIHKPSTCTSCTGFMYLCMHAVRILYKSFWVFLCVRLYVSSVAEQNPHLRFFSRNLSFFRVCQGPLGCGHGRGQEQHPNLPTCTAYRLCLGGGGWRRRWQPQQPQQPQLPWH